MPNCFDTSLTSNVKVHTFNINNTEDVKMIQHLFNRMSFGATRADIQYAHGKTIAQLVDTFIDTANDTNQVPNPDENIFFWRLYRGADDPFSSNFDSNFRIEPHRRNLLMSYWLRGMIGDNKSNATTAEQVVDIANSFKQKLVLFWQNHFVTELVSNCEYATDLQVYFYLLHKHALNDFKQLVKEIGMTPEMLYYLNGGSNQTGTPNENYAREVMELFTMGIKHPDTNQNNYTEQDIKELARALTGWTVNHQVILTDPDNIMNPPNCYNLSQIYSSADPNTFPFSINRHDWNSKNFLGTSIPATSTNNQNLQSGLAEYHTAKDIMFSNRSRSIAHFICSKLYKEYVYYFDQPSELEQVQKDFINDLANTFENNWQLAPVLKKLFKSQHFFDPVIRGAHIKSPIEYFVSMHRLTGLEFNTDYFITHLPDSTLSLIPNDPYPYLCWGCNTSTKRATILHSIILNVDDLGQKIFSPPNVAGWKGHHTWLNEYTYINRWVKMSEVFENDFKDKINNTIQWDTWESIRLTVVGWTTDLFGTNNIGDPSKVVEAILQHFFVTDMNYLIPSAVDILMKDIPAEEMGGWHLNIDVPNYITRSEVKQQLQDLFVFLIKQPEFNLS